MRSLRRALALAALAAALPATAARAQDENPLIAQVREQVGDPARPFVMLIKVEAKPGQGKALEAAFAPAIAATRKEKGCLAYDLVRSAKSPESYVLYERWANLDDLKAHLATKHIAELLPKMGALSAAPAALDVYVPAAE